MASSSEATDADLMSIGQHCSAPNCGLRDFLPFKCDCCHATFCLEHRTYGAHSCPKSGNKGSSTIVCPLCAKAIKLSSEEDADAAFDKHQKEGCDPANYVKVHAKQTCPVPACREKLTTVNTYCCKHCKTRVCLKHRFPQDHSCTERLGNADRMASTSAVDAVRDFFGMGRPASAQPVRQRAPTAAATTRAAVVPVSRRPAAVEARGMARPADSASQPRKGQGASPAASQREVCPLCSESFSSLAALIAHSRVHEQARELCPHCRAAFTSAVALVDHVERSHASSSTCVVC